MRKTREEDGKEEKGRGLSMLNPPRGGWAVRLIQKYPHVLVILDLARLVAGHLDFEFEPLNVNFDLPFSFLLLQIQNPGEVMPRFVFLAWPSELTAVTLVEVSLNLRHLFSRIIPKVI